MLHNERNVYVTLVEPNIKLCLFKTCPQTCGARKIRKINVSQLLKSKKKRFVAISLRRSRGEESEKYCERAAEILMETTSMLREHVDYHYLNSSLEVCSNQIISLLSGFSSRF